VFAAVFVGVITMASTFEPFIRWVEVAEATGPLAELYKRWMDANPGRDVSGILKTMSQRPEVLQFAMDMSYVLHFRDGHLPWKTKEMIGTFVSGLNQCEFCRETHKFFLRLKGADEPLAEALARGDLSHPSLTAAEKGLLEWSRLLTLASHTNAAERVQQLRDLGWTDPQIAEAAYTCAMFAFFNRLANAFGLEDPHFFQTHPLASKLGTQEQAAIQALPKPADERGK
jgi:uncharacterized peroxidase-related enzyme